MATSHVPAVARSLRPPQTGSGDHRATSLVSCDPQPVLTGDLLTLRPLRAGDFDALAAAAPDSSIWARPRRCLAHAPARDRNGRGAFARCFRTFFCDALASANTLVAQDAADGATCGGVIGASWFSGYGRVAREVTIGGTFLARSYWGGRHHGEMRRLMPAHAFRSVDRVLVGVGPRSGRAQRAIEAAGGVRVATPRGGTCDRQVVYAITAAAFAEEARTREHA